ncbi:MULTISPECIES: energy-coupling factor transporter transmembrane component T [Allobacillus]|nr:energy-coupling factor transporter transmembrane component T [Allobacillus salarius]
MCMLTLAMYFNHPIFLVTILLLLIFVNISHDRGKDLRKWLPTLSIMSTLIILINPFLVSRGTTILFYFRGKQVTLEAFMYGITMALFIAIILVVFISFNLILNGNRFLYIFSKILPRIALMIMMAIRFVPLMKRRLNEIGDVQRLRGMSMTVGDFKTRVRNGMLRVQILLTWSLEEAIHVTNSMKARGYGTEGKKSSYTLYFMDKRDWVWLFILAGLMMLCFYGGRLGYGQMIIYPELGPWQFFWIDWIVFCSMFIITSFPLFIEGREKIRWKLSI